MRRLVALALMLGGIALLGWVALQPQVQAGQAARAQSQLLEQVPSGPVVSDPGGVPVARPVGTGRPLAVMEVPRFGADWSWAVVEGTRPDLIDAGPGHYRGSAWPGAEGNAAFAAHRAGHGNPFIDFDRLSPGDEVVLTQGRVRWTYELTTSPRIIPTSAAWVLDPLPGRQLTLTTCWPRYGSEKRMFVRGDLVEVERRSRRRRSVALGRRRHDWDLVR